jgi:hypothetical protein
MVSSTSRQSESEVDGVYMPAVLGLWNTVGMQDTGEPGTCLGQVYSIEERLLRFWVGSVMHNARCDYNNAEDDATRTRPAVVKRCLQSGGCP